MKLTNESKVESINKENSNEMQYVCLLCEDRFKYESQLRVHLTVHTDERPFQCLICNNRFKRKGDLNRHMTFDHTYKYTHW